jgi:hypothetical protein
MSKLTSGSIEIMVGSIFNKFCLLKQPLAISKLMFVDQDGTISRRSSICNSAMA